jgi:hypothetical protein
MINRDYKRENKEKAKAEKKFFFEVTIDSMHFDKKDPDAQRVSITGLITKEQAYKLLGAERLITSGSAVIPTFDEAMALIKSAKEKA